VKLFNIMLGISCVWGVLSASAAISGTDPLSLYFNNVREYHHEDGEVHRFLLEPNHTFAMMVGDKVFAGGTWTYAAAGDELCTSITTPNPPPAPPGVDPRAPRCQKAHTDFKPGVWWEEVMANGMKERQIFVPRQK
jgi:hypothetical protein